MPMNAKRSTAPKSGLVAVLLLLLDPASSHSFYSPIASSRTSLRTCTSITSNKQQKQQIKQQHLLLALTLRGGAAVLDAAAVTPAESTVFQNDGNSHQINISNGNNSNSNSNSNGNNNIEKKAISKITIQKAALWTGFGSVLSFFLFKYRHQLFNKQFLQDHTVKYLTTLNENPRGLVYYIIGLAAWEAIGLSTIPVETAAGMAFGLQRGILASTCGKLSGAALAFLLGRFVLQKWVRTKLQDNQHFQLIQTSVKQSPTQTALLLKYSIFPEFVKNYGTALLDPIPLATFLMATLVHGGPFTCLWSWLGHDTNLRILTPGLAPNRQLQLTMVIAMTVGIVASPIAMGWWIQSLRQQQQQQQQSLL